MKYDIDILKSKTNRRVKRNISLIEIIPKYFLLTTWLLAFPIILGSMYFNAFNNSPTIQILFFTSIIFSCLMLYSILTVDNLIFIKGLSPETNKSISKLSSNSLKWDNIKSNKEYDVFAPKWHWYSTHYGREVSVIYDKNDVLINSTTFLLFNLQSPFHWLADRKTERRFKTEFEKEIKKHDTPTMAKKS